MDRKVKFLVFTSILAALVIVLQYLGGIPLGPFSITLTLFPIVVGAVVLGPVPGLVLGLVFGVVVSILSLTGKDPGGQMIFAANPFLAWLLCLLKGAMAGYVPAVAFRGMKKFRYVNETAYALTGVFLFLAGVFASRSLGTAGTGTKIAVTLICAVLAGALLFGMYKLFNGNNAAYYIASILAPICNTGIFIIFVSIFFRPVLSAWSNGSDLVVYVLTGLVGLNFIVEFAVSIVLAPAVAAIHKYGGRYL